MRLAVLSDAALQTPHPAGHGLGRSVSIIAEHLFQRGHDVTLYAKQGSRFSGRLVTPETAEGYEGEWILAQAALRDHKQHAYDAFWDAGHLHCIAEMFTNIPVVCEFHDAYQEYARCPVLKSNGQKALMPPQFEGARVIYNALDPAEYPFNEIPDAQNYALFMGAISQIKQPLLAIEACARMGVKLVMAGMPVDAAMPFTEHSNVEFVGAVQGARKLQLLQNARVFLQLGIGESFGLTTLEANLCGTPVVAWPTGGSLDIIRYGVNGIFVIPGGDKVQAVCDAIDRAWHMDRRFVRAAVEGRFSIDAQVTAVENALIDCVCGEWW